MSTMCTEWTVYAQCTLTLQDKVNSNTKHNSLHFRMMRIFPVCIFAFLSFNLLRVQHLILKILFSYNTKSYKTDLWLGDIDTILELVVRDIDRKCKKMSQTLQILV